jgi:hypothetical protein
MPKLINEKNFNFVSKRSTFLLDCRKLHYLNYLKNLDIYNIHRHFNYFIRNRICEVEFQIIPEEFGDETKREKFILQETSLNIMFNLHFPEKDFQDEFYLPQWVIQYKHFEMHLYTSILLKIQDDLNKNIKNIF